MNTGASVLWTSQIGSTWLFDHETDTAPCDRFARLGVNWACTLIAGIALLISPSPFIFYKYGPRIRQGSSFAPCLDLKMKEQLDKEEKEQKEKKQGMNA